MSVSVIIPTYNQRPELLDAAIASALQAGADQVVVVDDGSDEPVTASDNRVEVHRIEHAGVPAAFNEALRHISSDFVCRFASDDEMDANKIERQLEWMTKIAPCDATFHDCREVGTYLKYETGMPPASDWPDVSRERWRRRLRQGNRFYGGTSMIRTKALRHYLHPLDLLYSQDWYLNNWVEKQCGWTYIPEILSTIGRYDHGLEASAEIHVEAHGEADRCRALAAERISNIWNLEAA